MLLIQQIQKLYLNKLLEPQHEQVKLRQNPSTTIFSLLERTYKK
jgi:hypothetical protein